MKLNNVLRIVALLLMIVISAMMFLFQYRIDCRSTEQGILETQEKTDKIADMASKEIRETLSLVNAASAMIISGDMSMYDTYNILVSTKPNISWSVYAVPPGKEADINIEINDDMKLVVSKTDTVNEMSCLHVEGILQDMPVYSDDLLVFICENGKYIKIASTGNSQLNSLRPQTFTDTYPAYKQVDGDRFYRTEQDISGTDMQICSYVSRKTLLESHNVLGNAVRTFILITLIVTLLISIGLWALSDKVGRTDQIMQEKEAAKQANEAKNMFLANMSHEIRTPLNSILGMNEIILRESSEKQIRGYSKDIKNAGTALLTLINDILDFSKIEAGNMEIIESPYHLRELLTSIYTVFDYRAKEKSLEFIFNIEPDIPEQLTGDSIRIQQIISNLLSNAIKYTDTGRVAFYMRYEPSGIHDIILNIKVEDTGKGIQEKNLSKIFNKFQRVDMQNNNTIEGTGLGLAITKELVEKMDGEITVQSVYMSGSIFNVRIKQRVYTMTPIGQFRLDIKEEAENETDVYAPDARILIVDDTKTNLVVAKKLLEYTGACIETASSGLECISKADQNKYDIIFMDDRMPQMDGAETLRILIGKKIVDSSTKIIMMTANVTSGAKDKYTREGFCDYIPKPASPDIIYAKVREYLPAGYIKPRPDNPDIQDTNKSIEDKLKDITELSLSEGVAMCGDIEGYVEIIREFVRSSEDLMHDIEGSVADRDYNLFAIKAHSLKSSSRLIGAMTLSEKAAALEKAGNEQDERFIKDNYKEAMEALKTLVNRLSVVCQEFPEASATPVNIEISRDDVRGIFEHMYTYANEFNDEALKSMIRAIEAYRLPEPYGEALNNFKTAVMAGDWETILGIFREIGYGD